MTSSELIELGLRDLTVVASLSSEKGLGGSFGSHWGPETARSGKSKPAVSGATASSGPLGQDDIAEHEQAASGQRAGDAPEEVALSGRAEVVDGERRDDDVEWRRRQGILQVCDAQVDAVGGEDAASLVQHRGAGIDSHEMGARVEREQTPRGLTGADAKLQDAPSIHARRRIGDCVLEFVIATKFGTDGV